MKDWLAKVTSPVFDGHLLLLRNQQWVGSDPDLQKYVDMANRAADQIDYSPADGDPNAVLANAVAEMLFGDVEMAPQHGGNLTPPGVVY